LKAIAKQPSCNGQQHSGGQVAFPQDAAKIRTAQSCLVSGKVLVGMLSAFFVIYFVFEAWLMRGLPH